MKAKSPEEISKMREGGQIAARILNKLSKTVKPGITTKALDKLAMDELNAIGAKPAFLGHAGFPAAICASINEEIVHGIPTDRELKEGDVIGIDFGVLWKGYHTDTAITVPVGKIDEKKRKLIEITMKALDEAIRAIKPGIHLGDVQYRIQTIAESAGFGVIRDLAGHGIGKELQEAPSIPNFGKRGTGPILEEGHVFAIEPMFSAGDWHVKVADDGWTVVMVDGSTGAHFEHTIAVTKTGAEALTKIQ